MNKEGISYIAGILAGSGNKINGLYVEYGPATDNDATRTKEYFNSINDLSGSGYIRIPASRVEAKDNGSVVVYGIVSGSAAVGTNDNGKEITHISVVGMKDDNRDHDVLIATCKVNKTAIIPNCSVMVSAGFSLGE